MCTQVVCGKFKNIPYQSYDVRIVILYEYTHVTFFRIPGKTLVTHLQYQTHDTKPTYTIHSTVSVTFSCFICT